MQSSSNGSFIPKRGEHKGTRRKQKSQVYLFTIISYVLVIATLLAAGAVFLYGKYIDTQIDQAIAELNQEISSFNEADMQQVQDFHGRMSQAKSRLDNSASVVSTLEAIEAATIGTVRISSLQLAREGDSHYLIESKIETDNFDSSLFQRGVLERSDEVIDSIVIQDIQLQGSSEVNTDDPFSDPSFAQVGFATELIVPLSAVPYTLEEVEEADPLTVEQEATATSSSNQLTP